ncbi:MAG: hypothetical protein ACI9RI_001258 [Oceanospirillaceae bacterium]|jgi:hypothetical protein
MFRQLLILLLVLFRLMTYVHAHYCRSNVFAYNPGEIGAHLDFTNLSQKARCL